MNCKVCEPGCYSRCRSCVAARISSSSVAVAPPLSSSFSPGAYSPSATRSQCTSIRSSLADCFFVEKARYGQRAGAKAVMVADHTEVGTPRLPQPFAMSARSLEP